MTFVSTNEMKNYLSRSISSLNTNKLNGLLAEIEFRNYLNSLGFGDRVSVGGWIARSVGDGIFGQNTVVIFPETIAPNQNYSVTRDLPNPNHGLHTICSTFHQIGIKSYFCTPTISVDDDSSSITWKAIQLGLPTQQQYQDFPNNISGFIERSRQYNFLRYNTDVENIPLDAIADEFSKEHIRVTFQNAFMQEVSDIDGILWGNQYTYPIEIKEKTPAHDNKLGDYFGLDLGPFVKLAFYAAKRGNLHSIFVVREIDDTSTRNLVNWWYIKFDELAQYASWIPTSGGQNMRGGGSTVVKIPKNKFHVLDINALENL